MTKKLKFTPTVGEMGKDLMASAEDSLRLGVAIRVDGNHLGEPFSFIAAKGKKAVAHLERRLKKARNIKEVPHGR